MIDDFILYALLAAVAIACASGPLGCFVVWRRMAYFGDSLAHSALLGVALGIAYNIGTTFGILIICGFFSLFLTWLQSKNFLGIDTLLGIFAHFALSLGLIVLSFIAAPNIDIHALLFGDILTVTSENIIGVYSVTIFILIVLKYMWRKLILSTLNPELAAAEGINPTYTHIILIIMMTILVAFSLQIIGVLLVTSLLVIPAATARLWSHTPHHMALYASGIGIVTAILGIMMSVIYDTPPAPMIVVVAGAVFIMSSIVKFSYAILQNR